MANPNTPQRLVDRFIALSGAAKVQPDKDTGMLNADLDTRDRCEITREEVVIWNVSRDCRNQDITNETLRTRGVRFTLTYEEVTPQMMARWFAYFINGVTAPTGTPADEVQTLTVVGDGTLSLTLEGRTVTTKTIASAGITAAIIQEALTEPRMLFIQPGDVVVTGASSPFTLTFPNTGRLGRANLPLVVGTGGMSVVAGTDGAQNYHDMDRSVSPVKNRFSVVLGWENVTDRFEKYIGFVCDQFTPTLNRRRNAGLTVSIVGPWAPEILTSFDVPDCVVITPLLTDDCKVQIQSLWETTDVNTQTHTFNDNVPIDESAAFGFDSPDIQDLERGDQPTYDITEGIFASEVDNIWQLAYNSRTQAPVDHRTHFGMPGNRFTLIATKGKVKFQNNPLTYAGTLNKSVTNVQVTPWKDGVNPPISGEAYLDQATAFLVTSV